MAATIAKLQAVVDMDTRGVDKGAARTKSTLGGLSRSIKSGVGGAVKVLGGLTLGGAAAVGAVGAGIVKLAMDAKEIPTISASFRGLGGSIEAMRKGSLGMVTDVELMKSFNSAAQLVSQDFAKQMPDAMGYLSKVAAATGEDMGFMIDSLVKGVGRLSGPILDNLGIQVQLSDATARASEMFGLEAKELTKAQVQAGMMDVVMAKLAANTADMPDVMGSAAQTTASFQASMANLKAGIGEAFLPVLNSMLGALGTLVQEHGPGLVAFAQNAARWISVSLVPAIETVTGVVAGFVKGFSSGEGILQKFAWAVGDALDDILPEGTMDKVWSFLEAFEALGQGGDLSGLVSAFEPLKTLIADELGGLWGGLKEKASDWGGKAWEAIQSAAESAGAYVTENAGTWAATLGTQLGVWLGDAFVFLRDTDWTAVATNVWETIKGILDNVSSSGEASALVEGLKTFVVEALDGLLTGLGETISGDSGAFGSAEKILGGISSFFEEIKGFVSGLDIGSLAGDLGILLAAIVAFKGLTAAVAAVQAFSAALKALQAGGAVAGLLTALNPVTLVIGAIVVAVAALALAWKNDWGGIQTKTKDVWENHLKPAFEAIKTWLTIDLPATIENIKTWAEDTVAEITAIPGKIKETIDDWKQAGTDLILGLVQGIKDKATEVADAARQAAENAVDAVKGFLGVQSPSKVFTEIGLNLMEGLARGIDIGEAKVLKKVSDALGDLIGAFEGLMNMGALGNLPSVSDVQGWAGQFVEVARVLISAVTQVQNEFGRKIVHKAKVDARKVGQIIERLSVDLSKIKMYDLPDMTLWKEQMITVVRGVADTINYIEKRGRLRDLVRNASVWVEPIAKVVAFINTSLEGMKLAENLPDMATWKEQIVSVAVTAGEAVIEATLALGEATLARAAGLVDNVTALFALLGPDLSKAVSSEAVDFEAQATARIEQLQIFAGLATGWLGEVSEALATSIEWAGTVAGHVVQLFALLGPDLEQATKFAPIEGFAESVEIRVEQLSHVAGAVYQWLRVVDEDLAASIKAAGDVAQDVAKLFVMLGPDLAKATAINMAEDFAALAQERVDQLSTLAGMVYRWLRPVGPELAASIAAAAGVAESISKLFSILGIDLTVDVPGASFVAQVTEYLNGLILGAPLIKAAMDTISAQWASLEAMAHTVDIAGKVQALFGVLSLRDVFEKLKLQESLKPGQRRTGLTNVLVAFLEELRLSTPILKDGLVEIEALWDGALDASIVIADKIKSVFSAIAGAIKASVEATTAEGWDLASLLGLVSEMEQAVLAVGNMQLPSVGGSSPLAGPLMTTPAAGEAWASAQTDYAPLGEVIRQAVIEGLQGSELKIELALRQSEAERRMFTMRLGRLEKAFAHMTTSMEAQGV